MNQFHHFTLGQFSCTSLSDMSGEWHLPDLFGRVPLPELEALLAQVGLDLSWPRQGTALLVDTGTQKVLVDCGLPSARGGQLLESLAAAGLTPDQIDALFITHGDGDHIGGLSHFPSADIYLPRESHRLWTDDEDRMVDEFIKLFRKKRSEEELAGMEKGRRVYPNRLREMGDRLKLVEPDTEFLPGFRFFPAPGHRRDHVVLEIRSGDALLLHVADGLRHPIQGLRPGIASLFDSYPDLLAATAKTLLARAADSNALVFGAHFPFPSLTRIERDGKIYRWAG